MSAQPFVVTTARLGLRAWVLDDAERAFSIYGDPEVYKWFGGSPRANVDEQRAHLAKQIEDTSSRGFGHWAMIERATDELVGNCGFRPVEGGRELEIGFTVARSRWGRGYAAEIAAACIRHGFERLGAPRIRSLTMPHNVAARRVMEKLGLRQLDDERHDGIDWCVYVIDQPGRQ